MNFQTGKDNLLGAHKVLSIEWLRLKEHWKDKKAVEFESTVKRLEREVKAGLRAIEELDNIFKQIKEDCL